jgi:hypothetical protein
MKILAIVEKYFGMNPYSKFIQDIKIFTNPRIKMVVITYKNICHCELLIENMIFLDYDGKNPILKI